MCHIVFSCNRALGETRKQSRAISPHRVIGPKTWNIRGAKRQMQKHDTYSASCFSPSVGGAFAFSPGALKSRRNDKSLPLRVLVLSTCRPFYLRWNCLQRFRTAFVFLTVLFSPFFSFSILLTSQLYGWNYEQQTCGNFMTRNVHHLSNKHF